MGINNAILNAKEKVSNINKDQALIDPKKFETRLSPEEEKGFHPWLDKQYKKGHIAKGDYKYYKENNHGYNYDFRAAYKHKSSGGIDPEDKQWHWNDIGKKPNHPTFSNESIHYPKAAEPGVGGRWEKNKYIENPKVGPPIPPTKEVYIKIKK